MMYEVSFQWVMVTLLMFEFSGIMLICVCKHTIKRITDDRLLCLDMEFQLFPYITTLMVSFSALLVKLCLFLILVFLSALIS